jgi:hypothetical protein
LDREGGGVEKNQFISVLAHIRERNLRFGRKKIINKTILPSDTIIVPDAKLSVEYRTTQNFPSIIADPFTVPIESKPFCQIRIRNFHHQIRI